jgi:uncharacterized membrane protein YcaP (DUF421 family)
LFFDGWENIIRTLVVGICAYAALVTLVRVSGKRTLSKMNAFDLIVTVALGSTLAAILLNVDVALAEGVTALALLIVLQYVIAWLSVRSSIVTKIVKSEPRLLFFRGEFLEEALQAERVIHAEVISAIRASGTAQLSKVEAVILETDGSFTVLQRTDDEEPSALKGVKHDARLARLGD